MKSFGSVVLDPKSRDKINVKLLSVYPTYMKKIDMGMLHYMEPRINNWILSNLDWKLQIGAGKISIRSYVGKGFEVQTAQTRGERFA